MGDEHDSWVQGLGVSGQYFAGPAEDQGAVANAGPRGAGFGNKPHAVDPKKPFGKEDFHFGNEPGTQTPYGRLITYLPDSVPQAKEFNDATSSAVEDDKAVREQRQVLNRYLAGQKEVQDFINKYRTSYAKEITSNPSLANIRSRAREMDAALDSLKTAKIFFKNLKTQLKDAQEHFENAKLALEGKTESSYAKYQAEKAEHHRKGVETAIKAVTELGEKALTLEAGHLEGAIGSAVKVLEEVILLAAPDHDKEKAEELEKEGMNKEFRAANAELDATETKIAELAEQAADLKEKLETGYRKFQEYQRDAEQAYDRSTGFGFKFSNLRKHADWVKRAIPLANQTAKAYIKARLSAQLLEVLYKKVMAGMKLNDKEASWFAEGLLVARDMNAAQLKGEEEMQALTSTLTKMSGDLETMRDGADAKMAHPNPPPEPGFGKNPHAVDPKRARL